MLKYKQKSGLSWNTELFLFNVIIKILTFRLNTPSVPLAFQVAQVVKNPSANAGGARALGSISGLGRSPGVRNGNPLKYSARKNLINREAWQATVHRVAKSQMQLSD